MRSNKVRLLLTAGSCVGSAATGVVGVWCGYKLKDKPQNEITWKDFIPLYIACGATIGCSIASHKVSGKQIAAMAGLAASTQQLYRRYEHKLKEYFPEEKLKEVKREVMKDRAKITKKNLSKDAKLRDLIKTKRTTDEEFFYEPISDQFFYSTREKIVKSQNIINNTFINNPTEYIDITLEDDYGEEYDYCVSGVHINEWLKLLGIENMGYYDDDNFGWYYGDGDWYWDYNWGFFGGPWISVDFVEITEGDDKYTMLDYGAMAPYFGSPRDEDIRYKKEIKEAKQRWENEYA